MEEAEADEERAGAVAAAAASDAGWLEIEQSLSAMELPPVPPTSDPQRLLGYVVTILPKYTEMEMLVTHLRLYASTLEQEMEHVRSHVRVLGREVEAEREKKQFLERYAAQVVKERNELLHAKGAKSTAKKSSASAGANAAAHFAWHACCKKNAAHSLDLTPSISSFRGEKLQEAMRHIKNLQDELRSQETQRRDVDFLLKKTQREHDSKLAADRKHIHELERQLMQRAMLHSSLERKLYEIETALARHDQVREGETESLRAELESANARAAHLGDDNAALSARVHELVAECDELSKRLSVVTAAKNAMTQRLDEHQDLQEAAEAEIEALRSEVELLQTTEVKSVRAEYAARIQKLQRDAAAREHALQREIDQLRHELTRHNAARSAEASSNASNTSFFNWESFLDSPSECATPGPKRARRMSELHEDRTNQLHVSAQGADSTDVHYAALELERLSVLSSAVHGTAADTQEHDTKADELLADSCVRGSLHDGGDDVLDHEYYSEEEKDDERQQSPPNNDLAHELREMLSGLARRRVEEEHKAELVEHALQQFQQTMH